MNLEDILRDILFEKMEDSFIFRNAYLTLNIANGGFLDKKKKDSLPHAKFNTEEETDSHSGRFGNTCRFRTQVIEKMCNPNCLS